MTNEFEIFKIVLEKGLLALVAALFGWVLARSLERLRASLSWGGELLRQRMQTAKAVLERLREMEQLHINVIGSKILEGPGPGSERVLKAAGDLSSARVELKMLQADPPVLDALDHVVNVALDSLAARPPLPATRIVSPAEDPPLPPENVAWLDAKRKELRDAIRSFEEALADGFKLDSNA